MRTNLNRHARRALATLIAAVVGTGTLVAGASGSVAAPATVAVAQDALEGTLDWGVKASFRNYITGPIAHGSIEVRDPAARNDDGTFRFAEATGSADGEAGTAELDFAGEVSFEGHDMGAGPLLQLTVTDPAVRIDGDAGVLIADVVSKSLSSGELVEYPDVELADLDLSDHPLTVDGDVVTVTGAPATLTAEGVPAFADFYAAGTALDPVTFSVTLDPAEPDPVFEPAIEVFAADGVTPVGSTELSFGDTVVVQGEGFDPAGNVAPAGNRPPIPAGVPAGSYVVFGKFADQWQPSSGAASSSRVVGSQWWALAEAALNQVPAQFQSAIRAAWVPVADDGTFTATVTITQPTDRTTGEPVSWPETGTFGIYTYAAGGTVNADQELSVPLTVAADEEPQPEQITDATFEWGINLVSQYGSPAGGCSFFVAGIADGTEASYRTQDGDVHLLKRLADGRATQVTAENRCLPLVDDKINQRALFTVGTGAIDPATGAGTIAWTGAFTVYSYGGMVPWYVKDPVLTVDAEGHGTITAEVGGFSSSMENPDVKVPLDPEPDVTIFELSGVSIADGAITGTPVWAGVDYFPLNDPLDPDSGRRETSAIADEAKAANPNWGSWPTPIVDFHYRTGLSSYWHTSGLSADPNKPPLPVVIELDGGVPEFVPVYPITITEDPQWVQAVTGDDVTFTVTAESDEALTYQWQRRAPGAADWQDVDGATAATLTLPDLSPSDTGTYVRVVVSNSTTSVTSTAGGVEVQDAAPPTLWSGPKDVVTFAGYRAQFDADIAGYPRPTYLWKTSDDGGATWTDHGAAGTTPSVELTPVTADQDGLQVRAVGSNGRGPDAVTDPAELTVLPAPSEPTLLFPAGTEFDPASDSLVIEALGGGYPVPTSDVTLAVVEADVWADRDDTFDRETDTVAWNELQAINFTDGFVDAGLWVEPGLIDPAKDYVLVTFSPTPGDHSHDAEVAIPFADSGPVAESYLDWGVKESFRTYIQGPIAHGSIEVREPATQNEDGTFRFNDGTGSGDASAAELGFAGEVYFSGHDMGSGPLLELTVTDPRVSVSGSAGTLIADVVSKSLASGELVTYDDVELAALDLSSAAVSVVDGVASASGVPATLTADGVAAFADFYAAGTALDPVTFSVALSDEPPAPTPSVTISETENLDPFADQITVTGTGFTPADLTDGLRVGIGVPTNDGSVPALDPVETVTFAEPTGLLSLTRAILGSFEVTLTTGTVEPGTTLAVYTSPVDPEADPAFTTQAPITFAGARTPQLTVTPTEDLAAGTVVEVDGTGFAPNRKISIAFTANAEQDPEYGWPTGWLQHEVLQADASGALSRTITVAGTVTGSDVDCVDTQCYLASFSSAQASDGTPVDYRADRSQDVLTPVTFAADTDPEPEPEPAVTVAPSPVVQGEEATFTGTGFEPGTSVTAIVDRDAPPTGTGTLDWGVKESFRTYITGPIAHGSIEVREPATQNEDGTFRFGAGSGSATELGFGGSVYFSGHDSGSGPLLELTVADPHVKVTGDDGLLVADVVSRSLESGELVTYDDVELAELDFTDHPVTVTDGVVSASGVPAALTAEGVAAFADFYAAGTELDPVTFEVPVAGVTADLSARAADAGTGTVGEDGTVEIGWTVPAEFAVGEHTVDLVVGDESLASATFAVEAADEEPEPEPEPSVTVDPETVAQGGTVTFDGAGFGAAETVEATIEVEAAAASFTFENDNGQSLTVRSGDASPLAQRDGKLLVVDGGELDVTLTGLEPTSEENTPDAPAGFYLLTAVDNGPGEVASPAIGGVDTAGSSGTSQWITNFPYPGSEDIVVPIADGVAETSVGLVAADEYADCTTAPDGCVLYLRTDHRSSSNRVFDLRVPLEFVSADELADAAEVEPVTVTGTTGDDGAVSLDWTVPADFVTGAATVTLRGASSGLEASADFTITAASGGSDDGGDESGDDGGSDDGGEAGGGDDGEDGSDDLPDTGTDPLLVLGVGLALLAGGIAVALYDRRRRA